MVYARIEFERNGNQIHFSLLWVKPLSQPGGHIHVRGSHICMGPVESLAYCSDCNAPTVTNTVYPVFQACTLYLPLMYSVWHGNQQRFMNRTHRDITFISEKSNEGR